MGQRVGPPALTPGDAEVHNSNQREMALKSALTASLAGGAAPPAPAIPASKRSTLDPAAFPCLAYADVLDGKAPDVLPTNGSAAKASDQVVPLAEEVLAEALVGSAPTSVMLPDGTYLVRGGLRAGRATEDARIACLPRSRCHGVAREHDWGSSASRSSHAPPTRRPEAALVARAGGLRVAPQAQARRAGGAPRGGRFSGELTLGHSESWQCGGTLGQAGVPAPAPCTSASRRRPRCSGARK